MSPGPRRGRPAAASSSSFTKRGRPVAPVVLVEEPPPLAGSVEFLVEDEELLFSTGEARRTGEA